MTEAGWGGVFLPVQPVCSRKRPRGRILKAMVLGIPTGLHRLGQCAAHTDPGPGGGRCASQRRSRPHQGQVKAPSLHLAGDSTPNEEILISRVCGREFLDHKRRFKPTLLLFYFIFFFANKFLTRDPLFPRMVQTPPFQTLPRSRGQQPHHCRNPFFSKKHLLVVYAVAYGFHHYFFFL